MRRRPPNLAEFFKALHPTGFDSSKYTEVDRARDFKAVFDATDTGQRVLWQILIMAEYYNTTAIPGDPHMTHFFLGKRALAMEILNALSPTEAPEPQERTADQPHGDET